MSKDNLDTLPNCEISALFAKEVAGWTDAELEIGNPTFSLFADEVLPWLKHVVFSVSRTAGGGEELGYYMKILFTPIQASAPTFARAACIALIRARRAEKGASRV